MLIVFFNEFKFEYFVPHSFNTDLFCKELDKALKRLLPYEIDELTIWLKQFTANKPDLYVCLALVDK